MTTLTIFLLACLIVGLPLTAWVAHRLGYADGKEQGRYEASKWAQKQVTEYVRQLQDMYSDGERIRKRAEASAARIREGR